MKYEERKRRIKKLQYILNRIVTQSNLHNKFIQGISKKLDILILEHYSEGLINQSKENSPGEKSS